MSKADWLWAVALSGAIAGCANAEASSVASTELGQTSAALTTTGIDLIAIGSISGNQGDQDCETSAPLENGVPGNTLGGVGSGLAYAGGDSFIGLPDRGPNAKPYNSSVDDTTSFIPRLQEFKLKLKESKKGAALPYSLSPELKDTTLLFDAKPLVYGTGTAFGIPNGAPVQNDRHHHYFNGRSDNFDPATDSLSPKDARFDPESVRVSKDGKSVFISDEYGPYVYQFDRNSGERVRTFALPSELAVTLKSSQGQAEIDGNKIGRVSNKGMEGLAISPNGKVLFGAMQSPLLQDNQTNGKYTRIVEIDIKTGAISQYVYALTNIGTDAKPKYPTISDIVAVNDHEFLVDERDGKGLGDNSTAVFKKIFHIDLSAAQEVSGISGEANLAPFAVAKSELIDVVSYLTAAGYSANDIPAKLEGLAFGPDVKINGVKKHTLFLANDNDFLGTITDTNHPTGFDNANKFFVFAIDASVLPGYAAQKLD